MPVQVTDRPLAEIIIDGVEVGINNMLSFEWKAFVNGGYVIRARISDFNFHSIDRIEAIKGQTSKGDYLGKGRKEPVKVEFRIGWDGNPDLQMQDRVMGFITDLEVYGDADYGQFEFIAIDPASWLLNRGNGSGKVYRGRISDVITQVVADYQDNESISLDITETGDSPDGAWAMMRMDPQRFIHSLLDWSSELNASGKLTSTNWLIGSDARNGSINLFIKQQHELRERGINYGVRNARSGINLNDTKDYYLETNNFLSAYQMRLATQGISSVSGKYLDKKVEPNKLEIRDGNTSRKLKPRIDRRRGFSRPLGDKSTSIMAIPEHNAGDVGKKYEEYIGGKPRQLYLDMLPAVMRLRVRIKGDFHFDNGSVLGVSTVDLNWKTGGEAPDEIYFLDGRWIVYGFHHEMTRSDWSTNLYLYRIDYDSQANAI